MAIVSVQFGQSSLANDGAGNETDVVAITAVTLANSVVFWQIRADSFLPDARCVRVRLTATDQVTVEMVGPSGGAITEVLWWVVQFGTEVSVQRGLEDATGAGGDYTMTITSVDLAESFPMSGHKSPSSGSFSAIESNRVRLPSATQLRWQSNGSIGNYDYAWQVVSWDGAVVQHAQLALNSAANDSDTQNITAVTLARTFAVCSSYHSDTIAAGDDVPIFAFDDTDTVSITRPSGGDTQYNDGWDDGGWGAEIVQLPTGYTVQYVTGTITGGNVSADVAITAVDTAKAWVIGAGLNGIASGYSTSGDAGDSWTTGELFDTDTLRVKRMSSTGDATYAFFVISQDAASGETLTPTGVSSSARSGAISPTVALAPTGAASTQRSGSLAASVAFAPAGDSGNSAAGSISASVQLSPIGARSDAHSGATGIDVTIGATGIASRAQSGDCAVEVTLFPIGNSSGSATGAASIVVVEAAEYLSPAGAASLSIAGASSATVILLPVGAATRTRLGASRLSTVQTVSTGRSKAAIAEIPAARSALSSVTHAIASIRSHGVT